MEQVLVSREDMRWRSAHGAAVFAILCFYMLCPVAPERWAVLYSSYGKIFIISVAAIYFYKQRFRGSIEVKLVIVYALWLFVTRLLNTDYYLENELDLVISRFLCAVILPVGLLLDDGGRERLLTWLSAVMGGFYFVVTLLGLYAFFTGSYFYIPPENVVFGIDFGYYFNYLVLLQTNRTISAVWLYIVWCLMVYQFFKCRNKLWRVPIALALLVFYVGIACAFDRMMKMSLSLNVAMLLLLWGMRALKIKKNALKALVLSLAVLVSAGLMFKSFDLVTGGMSMLSERLGLDENRPSDQFIEYMGEDENSFTDPRELKDSLSADSPRATIYRSFLPTLRDEPLRILIGKYSDKIMQIPQSYIGLPFLHMHNFLLQTFMLTGALGFLIVLAFTVLLVRRTVRLYFSKDPRATTAVKSLCFPLLGLYIYGSFDCLMFTNSWDMRSLTTDIRELMFFLLAGLVLAYSYELAPDRKKGEPKKEPKN